MGVHPHTESPGLFSTELHNPTYGVPRPDLRKWLFGEWWRGLLVSGRVGGAGQLAKWKAVIWGAQVPTTPKEVSILSIGALTLPVSGLPSQPKDFCVWLKLFP